MNQDIKIIRSAISSLPSVGIVQFLKEKGFFIIGSDITENSSARYFVNDFFLVDKAVPATEEKVIEQYTAAIKKYGARWILSGPENEILLLAGHEKEISINNCLLFHPSKYILDVITDKYLLYRELKSVIPQKELCLLQDFNKASFFSSDKLILKPRNGRGSAGVFTVKNHLPELIDIAEKLADKLYIIQEFIDGREFTVDVLFDNNGGLLNAVIRERLAISSGIVVSAKTVKNDRILEYVDSIQKHFTFRGFNCIQFREENGEYYLTDINPRIGGGCILSLTASKSMADNFINLLHMNYDKLNYNIFDAEERTMYRYYSEVYV